MFAPAVMFTFSAPPSVAVASASFALNVSFTAVPSSSVNGATQESTIIDVAEK